MNIRAHEIIARKLLEHSLPLLQQVKDLGANLPTLTDTECSSIAINYPYPFALLRQIFPRVWEG